MLIPPPRVPANMFTNLLGRWSQPTGQVYPDLSHSRICYLGMVNCRQPGPDADTTPLRMCHAEGPDSYAGRIWVDGEARVARCALSLCLAGTPSRKRPGTPSVAAPHRAGGWPRVPVPLRKESTPRTAAPYRRIFGRAYRFPPGGGVRPRAAALHRWIFGRGYRFPSGRGVPPRAAAPHPQRSPEQTEPRTRLNKRCR